MGSVFCEKGCEWEFVNKQFRTSVVPREMDVSCVPKISVLTRNSSGEGPYAFFFGSSLKSSRQASLFCCASYAMG